MNLLTEISCRKVEVFKPVEGRGGGGYGVLVKSGGGRGLEWRTVGYRIWVE